MMQWSPDGTRYSIADYSSTSIIDANSGAVIRTLPTSSVGGRWSADSRSLLAWQGPEDSMKPVIVNLESGATQDVQLLPDKLYPVGWDTVDRLVWGRFDNQVGPNVLVTANLNGTDVRDWLRIEGEHSLDQAQRTTQLSR